MKRKLIITLGSLGLIFVLLFYTPVGAAAFSFFSEKVASLGETQYTGETTTVRQREAGTTTYLVWVQSNASTEPDYVYTVQLFYGEAQDPVATLTVSWAASEIPGTTELVRFTGLDMSVVTGSIYARVVR